MATVDEKPAMWKCGDSYQYPVPKPSVDPWEVTLEALLVKDKVECDAWKDEVQNLLIFAGLFSAVVTAFVVESCKSIRPDSADLSVMLLSRIASRLEGNSSSDTLALSFTSPPSSVIRVNIFWFLSLILSLTTALVGIVSLQWLREHQRYNQSLQPRQALGIFYMRGEALERWHVPRIFASLPLLLQAALLLFFAGIVDFLASVSLVVVAPVAALLLLPIGFIVTTTTFPTLQCFTSSIRHPSSNGRVPSPCPYKSPQSLAFRRLATSSRRLFTFFHIVIVRTLFEIQAYCSFLLLLDSRKAPNVDAWRYRLFPNRAYLFWAHRSWVDFDRTWLLLRNEHFDITRKRQSTDPPPQPVIAEPIYDSVRALATAAHGHEHHDPTIFAVYHCFQDLAQLTLSDDEYTHHHLQACYRDLVPTWNAPISNIASGLAHPPVELLHDVHSVLFLRLPGILHKAINPAHIFGKHMLELHTRILVNLYAERPRKIVDGAIDGPTGFFHWYTINMAEASADFLAQFFTLFKSFVETASTITEEAEVSTTFHTHSDLDEFISLAAFLTWHTASADASSKSTPSNDDSNPNLSILISTLDLIETRLGSFTSSAESIRFERPDYLFCCAGLYLKRLWQQRPGVGRLASQPNKPLFAMLLQRFQSLQVDILLPYEEILERGRLSDLYRKILPPINSPANFFSKGRRDFVGYGKMSGPLFRASVQLPLGVEKDVRVKIVPADAEEHEKGDTTTTASPYRPASSNNRALVQASFRSLGTHHDLYNPDAPDSV